ncbi:universal stress protein [Mesorhizobium sp. Root157]|uniref:DUF2249 domain-containing protein n=1 Tax=Mesorhizobium sp. Root157 TaxID=1736477 RepID=UPI0007022F68|nr:DUF2249 domain-containing protein [Mesorhizobium sp. Root157]KQZ82832.1 universal stress protein [Mesorhizobium sp. Root157]
MTQPYYDLDVRPVLRDGGEPFSLIMQAVSALAPGQSLRLFATFKPLPLFQVLGARGFDASAREIGNGDWEVIFTPSGAAAEAEQRTAMADQSGDAWPAPVDELDNRDLEPPEPMVKTLEGVEALQPGQTIAALLPREPVFLFEELEARGHSWRGQMEPEGHFRVVIRAGNPQR